MVKNLSSKIRCYLAFPVAATLIAVGAGQGFAANPADPTQPAASDNYDWMITVPYELTNIHEDVIEAQITCAVQVQEYMNHFGDEMLAGPPITIGEGVTTLDSFDDNGSVFGEAVVYILANADESRGLLDANQFICELVFHAKSQPDNQCGDDDYISTALPAVSDSECADKDVVAAKEGTDFAPTSTGNFLAPPP